MPTFVGKFPTYLLHNNKIDVCILTRKEFGQKLKELRMNVNLTQAAVAEYLGFEEKTGRGRVSDWERGKGQPDADTFLILCDLYGVRDILAEFKPELKTSIEERFFTDDEAEIHLLIGRPSQKSKKPSVIFLKRVLERRKGRIQKGEHRLS